MDVDSDSDKDDEKSNGLQDDDDRADDEDDDAGAETTMTIPLIPFLKTAKTTDNLSTVHPHEKQQ